MKGFNLGNQSVEDAKASISASPTRFGSDHADGSDILKIMRTFAGIRAPNVCDAELTLKNHFSSNSSSKVNSALLTFFLGGLGVHKFYLGKNTARVLYLLFCWTCVPAVLTLIDGIVLVSMSDADFSSKYGK